MYENGRTGKVEQTTGCAPTQANGLSDAPKRANLRERLERQRMHAQAESLRLDALMELDYLMAKHPEVARMLELMDKLNA